MTMTTQGASVMAQHRYSCAKVSEMDLVHCIGATVCVSDGHLAGEAALIGRQARR